MAKINALILGLILFCLTGCATMPPPPTRNGAKACLENCLENCPMPEKEVIKSQGLSRNYAASFDKTWESALLILQQYASINYISKKEGFISYIDTDGILLNKVAVYCDFPFAILIEQATTGTAVYVYPLKESSFMSDKKMKEGWHREIEKGFAQEQEDFLEQLSVQIDAKERWKWLGQG